MKKILFSFIVALLAMMMSGCKQEEPTAVLSEKMNATVDLVGYVRITTTDGDGQTATSMRKGQEVVILRGTKINEQMCYEKLSATTDNKGRFEIQIGVPAGRQIDEVRAIATADLNTGAKVGNESVGAHFYGEATRTNLKAYNGYEMIIEMTATEAKDTHKF
ncbi:MAG: hypothetical protein MJZ75_06785 [Paludibacteraceae bacterium]|nr:hypothetical protein [Paludibacteraceae bacterium]